MTDGLAYVEGLSDTEAKTNGGFLISYQTNYSGNVDYNNVADVSRSVTGVSSSATGNIIASGITINGTTGVQTWVITSVVGSFLKGEIVYVVGTDGTYAEKIDTITTDTSASTATITLSKDPKNIVVQRYQSSDFTAAWTANGNTTNLVIDKNKELLKENSTTPESFSRANDATNYAFRNLPIIKGNEGSEAMVVWQNKRIPDIYYQE